MSTFNVPQVAINDIGTAEDFLAAVDSMMKYFNDGGIIEDTVVKVDRGGVLLDIGYRIEGVIPSRGLSTKHDADLDGVIEVGDEIDALVLTKGDREGCLILSKERARYEHTWGTTEQLKENDEPVTGTVVEVVKGGLIFDIGLRGFLSASFVEVRRVCDLQPYIGRETEARIIEFGESRNNVALPRRTWSEQIRSGIRSEFLHQLQRGRIRKGVVPSIINFGAFVDLGGVDDSVHVSELSWKRIDHPSEVVQVGDEVTVGVLEVGPNCERVFLSLKATQEDSWCVFACTHAIGQTVPDKVTKLVPFGVFVRVEEGIGGLVHTSELASRRIDIPDQVVSVDEQVTVKIIDIGLGRRRISLPLKQANRDFTEEFDPTKYGMGSPYDEQSNYVFPEGFGPKTNEWMEGFETQRAEWEARHTEAERRHQLHAVQIERHRAAATEAAEAASNYSSEPGETTPVAPAAPAADNAGGILAFDEQLVALREKLAGN